MLICLVRGPDARLRDVADLVRITEWAAQRVVADLEEAGYRVGFVGALDALGSLPKLPLGTVDQSQQLSDR